ncbi:MAG: hypothetical protein Harvfovirus9_4 [Harvfovirus sp.]|uniref:Uncharacterized protein n=1 Tax=Harvfovirus sp. TaxID=2487768 RepID=A0A3G5A2Z6_9VIRU|nr:MAG: hypothetical protein Harvfovirus9_4 [Harvfovirus sp.]
MKARSISEFRFNQNFASRDVYPIYSKLCEQCDQQPEPSIVTLAVLNRSPAEIKSMTPVEIEEFRSIIAKDGTPKKIVHVKQKRKILLILHRGLYLMPPVIVLVAVLVSV